MRVTNHPKVRCRCHTLVPFDKVSAYLGTPIDTDCEYTPNEHHSLRLRKLSHGLPRWTKPKKYVTLGTQRSEQVINKAINFLFFWHVGQHTPCHRGHQGFLARYRPRRRCSFLWPAIRAPKRSAMINDTTNGFCTADRECLSVCFAGCVYVSATNGWKAN